LIVEGFKTGFHYSYAHVLESTHLHPLNFVKIIWRRRWYALVAFILVCGMIWAYALWHPNIYSSTAMLQVRPGLAPKDYVRPSVDLTPEDEIDTFRQLIQSRTFIERMIQEFQIGGYGTNEEFVMDDAVRSVRNNIQVESRSRNIFTVSYTTTDPLLAHAFTRRIVDELIRSKNSLRKARAIETDQFLDKQLGKLRQNLTATDEKIKQFKTSHPTPLSPAQEQAMMSLSREHALLERQYANLTNDKFQAQMTAYLDTNRTSDRYKIIDQANLPERPVSPNRVLLMLIGLGAGLVLGIGVALIRESLDTTNSS
jgi:succinoglycan biosynthesis transport protein ExoP